MYKRLAVIFVAVAPGLVCAPTATAAPAPATIFAFADIRDPDSAGVLFHVLILSYPCA